VSTATLSPAVAAALQPRWPRAAVTPRGVRLRVAAAWALLVLNVLTFYSEAPMVLPVPGVAGKALTQGALVLALLVALSLNRPPQVRPSVFLALLSALAVVAVLSSLRAEFLLGSVFRAGRLLVFVGVLWLLTPWWGRRDLLLVRAHLVALWCVMGAVLLGVLVAPGLAFTDGRLTGVLWPVPPTQVGHYAAVALGLAVVMWLTGALGRRPAAATVAVTVPLLLLSHTRTALAAAVVGVAVAGLSLFRARARVRRLFAAVLLGGWVAALTVSSAVTGWLARGQTEADLANLTGRRDVWNAVMEAPRTPFTTLFGNGLTNKSFGGLPIDSNWLATFHDVGLVGVALDVALVVFLLACAVFRTNSPARALALFLVTYCVIASFTETGLSDASPYLLELTLAASLLVSGARSSP